MNKIIERNKKYAEKYIQKINTNFEIPDMIKDLIIKSERILDLGCGYGQKIYSILNKYPKKDIIGVDISNKRINFLKETFPNKKFIVADVCNSKLKSNSFDIIISTSVIEHVENDVKFINEIYRLLKRNGFLYITSVIRKPYGIYKYRNKGKFVLDPTHEREYKNKEQFLSLFKEKFKLVDISISPIIKKIIFSFKLPRYYGIKAIFKKK
jgi:ubiquinone/menaquinone biosynthesis C-methylase UbiE